MDRNTVFLILVVSSIVDLSNLSIGCEDPVLNGRVSKSHSNLFGSTCFHGVDILDEYSCYGESDTELEDQIGAVISWKELHDGDQDIYSSLSPWLVSIQDLNYREHFHICGGTLLAEDWVITSAFCVHAYRRQELQVAAGVVHDAENSWQIRSIRKIIVHPMFNYFTREHDLALLHLEDGGFEVSWVVYPLEVSLELKAEEQSKSDIFKLVDINDECSFSGWRRDSKTGKLSLGVQTTKFRWTPWDECNDIYQGLVLENMFCVEFAEEFEGIGNWGAPMSCHEEVLIGLSSWKNEKSERFPTVFTTISAYTPWIERNMI